MKTRIITHSMAQCFRDCRVKFDLRYNQEIVPCESVPALDFGSAVHAGLEFWFKHGTSNGAVDAALARGAQLGLDVADQIKICVLIERYCEIYAVESWKVHDVECETSLPLRNPDTCRASRKFKFHGKADGIVIIDGKGWILEHKTTSSISQAYLDRIDIDAQIALYAWAFEETIGIPIVGAVYDIIEKPGIKWRIGETDEEFETRKAELAAKSKTGRSSAKKQEADSYDSFYERVCDAVTPASFRRVYTPIDGERMREAVKNLWMVSVDMRRPLIYPNPGNCTKFGQTCPYLALCRAHGDLTQCPDMYRKERAHIELEAKND